MTTLSRDDMLSFIETQLEIWPLAKSNYDALAKAERRDFIVGDLKGGIQWNPARVLSTGAKIDKDSIKNRKCFLCKENRPDEQLILNLVSGWDILVNPYPILPVHLTIASSRHIAQDKVPYDIVSFAESLPGMAVFFNGAKAGASAPDHLHMQAVLKDELPLLRLVEKIHSGGSGIMTSTQSGLRLPFYFVSGIVKDDPLGIKVLKAGLEFGGPDDEGRFTDNTLENAFFWIDAENRLRYVIVPRRSHRPDCYFAEGESNRMVSPGCIDMAGLIITPRENDFRIISNSEIEKIYSDVALPYDYL